MNYKDILINPSAYFDRPDQLVKNNKFTIEQKIELLQKWERDVHQISVAAEEGMEGDDPAVDLKRIHQALEDLHGDTEGDPSPAK